MHIAQAGSTGRYERQCQRQYLCPAPPLARAGSSPGGSAARGRWPAPGEQLRSKVRAGWVKCVV